MAAGDLLNSNGDIELRGVLLANDNAPYFLDDWNYNGGPDMRRYNTAAMIGEIGGYTSPGSRPMSSKHRIYGSTQDADRLALERLFYPSGFEPICWMSSGEVWCRFGQADGAYTDPGFSLPTECRFLALDPLTYGEEATLTEVTSEYVADVGNYASASWSGTVEGPCTNPMFSYSAMDGLAGFSQLHVLVPIVVDDLYTLTVDCMGWNGQPAVYLDGPGGRTYINSAVDSVSGKKAVIVPAGLDQGCTFQFESDAGTASATFTYRACY